MNISEKYCPTDQALAKHIEYYWHVDHSHTLFHNIETIYSYPGITPELIIPIEGQLQLTYDGKKICTEETLLSTVMPQNAVLNFSSLRAFIFVRFKRNALASLLPFVDQPAHELVKNALLLAENVFGSSICQLQQRLQVADSQKRYELLDDWLSARLNRGREGFVLDVMEALEPTYDLKAMLRQTRYSYSTVERLFKKETGLTPKKYLVFKRFKSCVEQLLTSGATDWSTYIEAYGYYDQSHFIKEVKKFTRYAPTQLLQLPSLPTYRPS